MKLSSVFVLSSLYCVASAASSTGVGHVYLWDPSTKSTDNQRHQTVDPETARLIFAQRLGLSQFHALKSADDAVVRQLNQYGGSQQQLFSIDGNQNNAHAIIIVEGVEKPEDIIRPLQDYTEFTLSRPPPASANARLLEDFMIQAKSLLEAPDPLLKSYNSDLTIAKEMGIVSELEGSTELTTINHISFFHIESLTAIAKEHGSSSSAYRKAVYALRLSFESLLQSAKREGYPITIVLMPPSMNSNAKRSANPYGSYDLRARSAPQQPRRQGSEAILSSPASPEASSSTNISTMPNEPEMYIKAQPVLGILPSCFDSNSSCQTQTRNCSGHGECYLSRKGERKAGSEGKTKDCYSCQCKPAVVKDGDKTIKTTRYGGPACQKKDVSMPFWLFAGTGVFLAILVSSAIGMLYGMGEEELPSVIGAGVSGPTRK